MAEKQNLMAEQERLEKIYSKSEEKTDTKEENQINSEEEYIKSLTVLDESYYKALKFVKEAKITRDFMAGDIDINLWSEACCQIIRTRILTASKNMHEFPVYYKIIPFYCHKAIFHFLLYVNHNHWHIKFSMLGYNPGGVKYCQSFPFHDKRGVPKPVQSMDILYRFKVKSYAVNHIVEITLISDKMNTLAKTFHVIADRWIHFSNSFLLIDPDIKIYIELIPGFNNHNGGGRGGGDIIVEGAFLNESYRDSLTPMSLDGSTNYITDHGFSRIYGIEYIE